MSAGFKHTFEEELEGYWNMTREEYDAFLGREGTIYAFEQVYLGNKTLDDIDWVTKFIESKFAKSFITKLTKVLEEISDGADKKQIVEAIKNAFRKQ